MTTTLIRHRVPRHTSTADLSVERTEADGHPPLPAPLAQTALRCEVQPRTPIGEPIAWAHGSNNAWGAVDRLHRADLHDEACTLARLLRWTEKNFSHDQAHGWTLTV